MKIKEVKGSEFHRIDYVFYPRVICINVHLQSAETYIVFFEFFESVDSSCIGFFIITFSTDIRLSSNVDLMLGQRKRDLAKVESALA